MIKLNNILKWIGFSLLALFIIYSTIWYGVSIALLKDLNKTYAGKNINISDNAMIRFREVKSSGFPFKFTLELHHFAEENNTSLVTHSLPVKISYDIISQTLSSNYKGESLAQYKPLESGFGAKLNGEYKAQIYLPLNITLFRVILLKQDPVEIINYINDIKISAQNVKIYDLVDNTMLIDDASLNLSLKVKHHRYYNNIDELLNAIPKDYSISISANSKNSSIKKKAIPFSIVYFSYLPLSFKYHFESEIHTDASKFSLDEILNSINIKTSRMHFSDDTEDIESKLDLSNINKDGIANTIINYSSDIKLGETFSKDLAKGIKSFVISTPSNSSFGILKDYLSPLNFELLDLNTGNDLIKFGLEAEITRAPQNKASLDIKKLGIAFQDKEFHIKSLIHNDLKSEKWFSGVIEIVNLAKIIDYCLKSYSKIYTMSNMDLFNDTFWVDLYVDFIESIASNINQDTANLALQFNLSMDMSKSKIGRYTLPEAKILYYNKLFNHIYAVSNNRTEALKRFQMIIPSYISDPKIFEQVTQEK